MDPKVISLREKASKVCKTPEKLAELLRDFCDISGIDYSALQDSEVMRKQLSSKGRAERVIKVMRELMARADGIDAEMFPSVRFVLELLFVYRDAWRIVHGTDSCPEPLIDYAPELKVIENTVYDSSE
jgi:hypothetical protein